MIQGIVCIHPSISVVYPVKFLVEPVNLDYIACHEMEFWDQ